MVESSRAARGASVRASAIALLALVFAAAGAMPAEARHHHARGASHARYVDLGPTNPAKDAALIEDGATGRVLYARNADALRHPASLTKMMTLYMLFDALQKGQLKMDTPLTFSEHAASMPSTNLNSYAGETIPVETAIKAIVVQSANDVAVAIAEALGGTESNFAQMMTQKARQLGMRNTFYHNASGLPDEAQITTAADLALLARHLVYDFPGYFHYFSTESFSYGGRFYSTHDNLLGNYDGCDGIKTGYTEGSGFNLVSDVVRGRTRLIGVVMGGYTAHRRDQEMIRLMDMTFAQLNQNPALVASNGAPWQNVARNGTSNPVLAGFDIGAGGNPPSNDVTASQPTPAQAISTPAVPDIKPRVVASLTPTPRPALTPPAAGIGTAMAALSHPPLPKPRPNTVLASNSPQVLPAAKPTPRGRTIGEGDFSVIKPAAKSMNAMARDWTIQIGAFNDPVSAKAQLSAYAERSMDVLGTAERIVVPFESADGSKMYRARFGPFLEAEARQICARLTQRGQTCFAAIAN